MDRQEGPPVWSHTTGREPITEYRQTSDYMWYAVQRRVLSYLLTQKEVDASRVGAKGYSYGGTIMWNLAMDPRVKATVAYFGIGWNEYYRSKRVWMYNNPYREPEMDAGEKVYLPTMAPQAHAPYITAATLWLNGSNDHHGGHERAGQTFGRFKPGVPWDFAVQAVPAANLFRVTAPGATGFLLAGLLRTGAAPEIRFGGRSSCRFRRS